MIKVFLTPPVSETGVLAADEVPVQQQSAYTNPLELGQLGD